MQIDLSDNALKGSELAKLTCYPKIESISFGGNQVKTIEELDALKGLPALTQLDLFNNPVSSVPDYRSKVFALLKNLKVRH